MSAIKFRPAIPIGTASSRGSASGSATPMGTAPSWSTATGYDPMPMQGIWTNGNVLYWHGADGHDETISNESMIRALSLVVDANRHVEHEELAGSACAGGVLGALLVAVAMPRVFARTFTMRRWIARAERARMKREAEQGAIR